MTNCKTLRHGCLPRLVGGKCQAVPVIAAESHPKHCQNTDNGFADDQPPLPGQRTVFSFPLDGDIPLESWPGLPVGGQFLRFLTGEEIGFVPDDTPDVVTDRWSQQQSL